MTSLDRCNEIFVWRLDCAARIAARKQPLVCRHKTILSAVSQKDRGAFGGYIANCFLLITVFIGTASYSFITCRILDVFGHTQSNPEIRRAVFQ